ncbi:uncharacterized protein LOC142229450 [Haematobia irritans]|uniref:uncharacterized protein LOC142229450 n=1 Tax=Haematobia irritans TaxID=7368 RepID=UPI003F4FF8F2
MFPKACIEILVFLSIIAVISAQGAIYFGNKRHPTLNGHCYDDDNDLTIKINETVYPTNIQWKCFSIFCREDYVLQINNCPRHQMRCIQDFSKPYPECCYCGQ